MIFFSMFLIFWIFLMFSVYSMFLNNFYIFDIFDTLGIFYIFDVLDILDICYIFSIIDIFDIIYDAFGVSDILIFVCYFIFFANANLCTITGVILASCCCPGCCIYICLLQWLIPMAILFPFELGLNSQLPLVILLQSWMIIYI